MGIASKVIGALISAAGVVILFYGMNTDPSLSFIWFLVGLLVMSVGFGLINGGREDKLPEPPPPTITEIHCENSECDFKEIREFEKGDYVLKPVNAKCPKCASSMVIQGIYIVKEEKEKIEI